MRYISKLLFVAGILLLALPLSGAREERHPFTLVIDAGHGGHDVGAVDNGAREKDINLGVATRLRNLVEKKLKNVKVVMTRDDDTFVSLQDRANIANRNHGNLFLSIHTNSVDKSNRNRASVAGSSVYALGLHKDDNNLRVARRENSVIELESDYQQKYSGFDPSKDESYIIFEMAQKKNLGQSLKFASMAQKQLVANAGRADRGVKQAGFWVLWATSMPSVLVELDFICNPASARFMNSDEGREKLAQSLFNAVEDYVEHYNNGTASILPAKKTNEEKAAATPAAPVKNTTVGKKNTVSTGEPGTGSSRKKDKKSDSRKNKKKKKKSSAKEKPVATVTSAVAEETEDDVPVLASAARSRAKRDDKAPAVADSPRQYRAGGGARRRRSTAARKISDSRVVETESILLLSENTTKSGDDASGIAAAGQNAGKSLIAAAESGHDCAEASRQGNVKDSKANGDKEKAARKKDRKSSAERKGQKRFVVKSTGAVLASAGETSAGFKVRNEKIKTVYKIQVLASSDRLMENNPQFCGLKPIKAFKENNMYKYTYGESENRREIEKMLLDVKSKIPDAFIIISKK